MEFEDKVNKLLGQPEGIELEYKQVLPPPSAIAREIAAFANSAGGTVIFGVRDDLSVEGLAGGVPAPAIVEAALERLNYRPNVQHGFINVGLGQNQRTVYAVSVDKSPQTVATENNTIYFRFGSGIKSERATPSATPSSYKRSERVSNIFNTVEQNGKIATSSLIALLQKYRDLFLITHQSINILSPEAEQTPSSVPHGRTLMRLLFAALIDSFETYLADLLLEIHLANPNTLKSEGTISIERALSNQDMAELIHMIALDRVSKLKRGDEEGFTKSFKSTTGTDILSESDLPILKTLFQVRHIYTHNNGRVDKRYIEKQGSTSYRIGDEHKMTLGELCDYTEFILNIVGNLDKGMINKYNLGTYSL